MRSLVFFLVATVSCSGSPDEVADPLSEPELVAAVDALVHLEDASWSLDDPHPGPAAVGAVRRSILAGGSALKEAAISALDDANDKRRLIAHLALQTLGVSDAELNRLAASPEQWVRLWAILATDGFPRAQRPSDDASEVSQNEAHELVAQHAEVMQRLFAMDAQSLAACSEEYQEAYFGQIMKMLKRPAEHVNPLHARRSDVTGDGADDCICTGRLPTGHDGSDFLFVIDGKNGEVLVEKRFESGAFANAPKCIDVNGDGQPEVLVSGDVGNPNQQVVQVFGAQGRDPVEFAGRFVSLLEDPASGAIWFIEVSPFNAFGATSTMLASSYGARLRATRLGGGLGVAEAITLHTNVDAR